jgi:hypothetical protein
MAITYTAKVHKTALVKDVKHGFVTVTQIDDTEGIDDVSVTRRGDVSTQPKAEAFIDSLKVLLERKALAQATNKTDYAAIEANIVTRLESGA